jgi:hypothetical protein
MRPKLDMVPRRELYPQCENGSLRASLAQLNCGEPDGIAKGMEFYAIGSGLHKK